MRDCDNCKHNENWLYSEPCFSCEHGSKWEKIKQTNADKYFRNATDEEIAKFFEHGEAGCHYQKGGCPVGISCRDCWLDWLKQEVQDV